MITFYNLIAQYLSLYISNLYKIHIYYFRYIRERECWGREIYFIMQYISFCRYKLSALSEYSIWPGVNQCFIVYPNYCFYAGVYKRIIDTI